MMNENLKPEAVKQLLNRSLAQLDQPTLANLREARMHALERYEARRVMNPSLAWISDHIHWHASTHHHRTQFWIAAVLIVACLLGGIAYWQQTTDNDTSDVDIEILTDDLPIHVYVD